MNKSNSFLIASLLFFVVFSLLVLIFSPTPNYNYEDLGKNTDINFKLSSKPIHDMSSEKKEFIKSEISNWITSLWGIDCDEFTKEDTIEYCKNEKEDLEKILSKNPKLRESLINKNN